MERQNEPAAAVGVADPMFPQNPPITFRAGALYFTRGGDVALVAEIMPDERLPLRGAIGLQHRAWTIGGHLWDSGVIDLDDLVSEVPADMISTMGPPPAISPTDTEVRVYGRPPARARFATLPVDPPGYMAPEPAAPPPALPTTPELAALRVLLAALRDEIDLDDVNPLRDAYVLACAVAGQSP